MVKELLKKMVKAIPIAFTQNQRYDRLTKQVIRQVCRTNSNTVDVGCHKGEILDLFRAAAPAGEHYGFEPVPDLYDNLVQKYRGEQQVHIQDIALSDHTGTASFNYVVSNPSYSGLKRRQYDRPDEKDTQITVKTEKLDNVLPTDFQVDLIKIDVEGGEMLVLTGAVEMLRRCKPVVIFEHGIGASDHYGATPEKCYELFESCGMQVSLLERFLSGAPALSKADFCKQYYDKLNYYFIAYGA